MKSFLTGLVSSRCREPARGSFRSVTVGGAWGYDYSEKV